MRSLYVPKRLTRGEAAWLKETHGGDRIRYSRDMAHRDRHMVFVGWARNWQWVGTVEQVKTAFMAAKATSAAPGGGKEDGD